MWIAIVAAFTAIGKMLEQMFSWLRDQQLVRAGQDKERLKQADQAEESRKIREETEQRIDSMSDAELAQLRDTWTKPPDSYPK